MSSLDRKHWVWRLAAAYMALLVLAAAGVAVAGVLFWNERAPYQVMLMAALQEPGQFRIIELAAVLAPIAMAGAALLALVVCLLALSRKRAGLFLTVAAALCALAGVYVGRRTANALDDREGIASFLHVFKLGMIPFALLSLGVAVAVAVVWQRSRMRASEAVRN